MSSERLGQAARMIRENPTASGFDREDVAFAVADWLDSIVGWADRRIILFTPEAHEVADLILGVVTTPA